MTEALRIGVVSTLSSAVRAGEGGSVEGLIGTVVTELCRRGHDVTLFASGDSEVPCELIATLPGPYGTNGAPADWHMCEWMNLTAAVRQSGRFDVLHSHVYVWGLPLQALSQAPMAHTTHVTPSVDDAAFVALVPGAPIIAISRSQWQAHPAVTPAAIVHHGIDPRRFPFRADPDDYLCWLGRFIPGKGPLQAIGMARELGVRLLLAAPPNIYFHEEIRPHVDGRTVEYVGAVAGKARSDLLGAARALLYPVQEPEPFGLVMIEAMMCGTPVIASPVGAVPEIVQEGLTGAVVHSASDLPRAYSTVIQIDRSLVRHAAESRFSASRMADGYESAYLSLVR